MQKIQEVLKSSFKNLFQVALKAEFNEHIRYDKHQQKVNANYHNKKDQKALKITLEHFKLIYCAIMMLDLTKKLFPNNKGNCLILKKKTINIKTMGTSMCYITAIIKDFCVFNLDQSYISKITGKIFL